jgi:general secretion pathway protein J
MSSRTRTRGRPSGFTLIEVLIAIVIFAVMAAMAYRGLTAVLDTRTRLDEEASKWRAVSLLFTRMERDFAVITTRQIRDSSGQLAPAFKATQTLTNEYDAQLAFTRMGSPDAGGTLSAPQRIGYRLRNGNAEYVAWPVLDQGPRTLPAVSVVLPNVEELSFRYLDGNGQWQTNWPNLNNPQGVNPAAPPWAVEVTLRLRTGEQLKRVYVLPALTPPT